MKTLFIGPFSPPYTGDGVKNDLLRKGFEEKFYDFDYTDTISRGGNQYLLYIKILLDIVNRNQVILSLNKRGRIVFIIFYWLLKKVKKKKAVLFVVGGSFDQQLNSMYGLRRKIYIKAINSLSGVFAESKKMESGLKKVGIRNVSLVYNPRKDSGDKWELTNSNAGKVVFVSRVTKTKGIFLLTEAIKQVKSKGKSISLDVFGPIDPECAKQFNELIGKYSWLKYCGQIKPEEVQSVLTNYHFLALPTFHPGEGLPGILVEAGMAGLPIIISAFNALPEYFVHAESALLTEPLDVMDLSEKIILLLDDNRVAGKISSGILKVVEPFMLDAVIDKSVQLLKQGKWQI